MNPLSQDVQEIMRRLGSTRYTADIDRQAADIEANLRAKDRVQRRTEKLRAMGAPDYLAGQLATRHRTLATNAVLGLGAGIVVLSGPVGTGKSLAALGWLMSAPDPVLYLQASGLTEIRPWAKKPWVGRRSIVVDDLGTEHKAAAGLVDELVLYVHGRRNATLVLTTNLLAHDTPERQGFNSRYGARVARRIRERPALANKPWVTISHCERV